MAGVSKTRLSRIHPYPGMIADGLSLHLCQTYVNRGDVVFDPFVGTGRTLIAANSLGANGVGIDLNPLAVILARAKGSKVNLRRLKCLLGNVLANPLSTRFVKQECLLSQRKVDWFPPGVTADLYSLIDVINNEELPKSTLTIVAAVLSATIREVSYCRKDQWKLHRLSESARRLFYKPVKEVFCKRLGNVINELNQSNPAEGNSCIFLGDSRQTGDLVSRKILKKGFDLIITSPPYGDSRSTVQYGAISQLSLTFLQNLKGFTTICSNKGSIDGQCLGGSLQRSPLNMPGYFVKNFWKGDESSLLGRRVSVFLSDLRDSCRSFTPYVNKNGKVIFVVSRRNTGGHELMLDAFLKAVFDELGCRFIEEKWRSIKGKMTPFVVRVDANAKIPKQSGDMLKKTMREECILVFEKS